MSAEFLNSPIIPGKPVDQNKHGQLITVLVIVIVAVIAVLVYELVILSSSSQMPAATAPVAHKTQGLTSSQVQAVLAATGTPSLTKTQVKKVVTATSSKPLTPQQVQSIINSK